MYGLPRSLEHSKKADIILLIHFVWDPIYGLADLILIPKTITGVATIIISYNMGSWLAEVQEGINILSMKKN